MNYSVPTKRKAPASSTTENSEASKCIAPFEEKTTSPFVFDSQHIEGEEDLDETTIAKKLLNSKLNQMSLEERSDGLHDLHCVSDRKIVETPEMIKSKISEMTIVLNNIVSRENQENSALRDALMKSPKYVHSLKLRFLRADEFHVESAAGRMVRFFSQQSKYFGKEKIYREIRYEDLGKEEVEALKSGMVQLFPIRDQASRTILLFHGKVNLEYSTETVVRVLFYFLTSIFSDVESQRNGAVVIYYGIGQERTVPGRAAAMYSLYQALPISHHGAHYCQDSSALLANHNIIIKLMEGGMLSRLRFHFGSPMECIYILMTFGISRDAIPFSEDGTFDLTHHHRILEILKYREKQMRLESSADWSSRHIAPRDASVVISPSPLLRGDVDFQSASNDGDDNVLLVPGPMDILLGRGLQQQKRPGMIRLDYLLEEYWDRYEAASSKFEKTVITGMIQQSMKESKCRFLQPVSGGYIECDETASREKISHSFRSLRKKHRRSAKGKTSGTKLQGK